MEKKLLPHINIFNRDKYSAPVGDDFVYALLAENGKVKIGTTNNLWNRIYCLQNMNAQKLEPVIFWRCHNGKSIELAMHIIFQNYREHGEWFSFGHYDDPSSHWKYKHLMISALLTCQRPPIPIHSAVLSYVQYDHIQPNDPLYNVPGGGNWTGKECYPPDLFAPFIPKDKGIALSHWIRELEEMYYLHRP